MTTNETLTSDSVIVVPNGADLYDNAYDETLEEWAVQKEITYRRFDIDEDNLTGDIDKSSYTDVSIYGQVDTTRDKRQMTKHGYLKIEDAWLFLPTEIRWDRDNVKIPIPFRPQIDDIIIEDGVRFRIITIQPHYIGESELSLECGLRRLKGEEDIK